MFEWNRRIAYIDLNDFQAFLMLIEQQEQALFFCIARMHHINCLQKIGLLTLRELKRHFNVILKVFALVKVNNQQFVRTILED